MSDESGKGSLFQWPTILTALVVAGGVFFYWAPLRSSRPQGAGGRSMHTLSVQDVDARLWQDPLAAVDAHRSSDGRAPEDPADARRHELRAFLEVLRARLDDVGESRKKLAAASAPKPVPPDEQPRLIVLPVMIDGGPTAVHSEVRHRARVAVLSALGVSGYEPVNGDHIGYFKVPWPVAPPSLKKGDHPAFWKAFEATLRRGATVPPKDETELLIPYEWCAPRFGAAGAVSPRNTTRVLILWLRDEMFSDFPLLRLALLARALEPHPDAFAPLGPPAPAQSWPALEPDDPPPVAWRVLGPRNSTSLRRMLEEAANELDVQTRESLANAAIFSHNSTASEELLMHEMPLNEAQGRALHKWPGSDPTAEDLINLAFNRGGPGVRDKAGFFARTTPTDDAVCTELVRELRRRDVRPGSRQSPVAVISEWDTFYGRALPVTFMRAALKEDARAAAVEGKAAPAMFSVTEIFHELKDDNDWGGIYWYSYLQGIDGRLPADKASDKGDKSDKPAAASEKERPATPTEQPEGLDQSDYLRRLAERLVNLDRRIKADGDPRGLRAVGVLGSDVYDKLMVLRALRSRLPGVLFFTNNLDARLAHGSEWDAAHNLIVASNYGLQLDDDKQRNVAPFRDSYQTATYAATLMATNSLAAPRDPNENLPRVFEIGRSGPYDLSLASGPITTSAAAEQPGWWNPHRRSWFPWFLVFVLLLGFYLAVFFNRKVEATLPGQGPGGAGRGADRPKPTSWPPRLPSLNLDTLARALSHTPSFVAAAAIITVAAVWVAYHLQRRGGEPFAFFEGISIWPTEGMRLLAGLLCIHFMIKGFNGLRRNDRELRKEFPNLLSDDAAARRIADENHAAARSSALIAALMNFLRITRVDLRLDPTYFGSNGRGTGNGSRPVDPDSIASQAKEFLNSAAGLAGTVYEVTGGLESSGPDGKSNLRRKDLRLTISATARAGNGAAQEKAGAAVAEPAPDPAVGARAYRAAGAATTSGGKVGTQSGRAAAVPAIPAAPTAPAATDAADHHASSRAPRWTLKSICTPVWDEARRRWNWWYERTGVSPAAWPVLSGTGHGHIDAELLWKEYRERGELGRRVARVLPVIIAYLLFGFAAMEMFGKPTVPHRGEASWWIDLFCTMFAVVGSISLTFFVVDASRLSERFIHYLSVDKTAWHGATLDRWRSCRKLDDDDLADYLDIQFIARRTALVAKLIYFPFIVLALMILSRLPVFDNWNWPPGLILLMSLNSLYAIWAAFTLRSAAEKARRQVLERLRDRYVTCLAADTKCRADVLKELISEISSVKTGAFAPISQHPVLGAFLLPSGGLGIWMLVEMFAR